MRRVSGGTKRPSYFATTRTHGGELAVEDSRRPISCYAKCGACAGGGDPARRVRLSMRQLLGRGDAGWRRPFGARRGTAGPEVARSDSETRVRTA
jgi:hypothetical protein